MNTQDWTSFSLDNNNIKTSEEIIPSVIASKNINYPRENFIKGNIFENC